MNKSLLVLSHWCVAGEARRRLADFGYWYAPDGRTAAQQQAFERVEIKPQALECLFTLACERSFEVSQDNLFADFDTSNSTFANDVYRQVQQYIAKPNILPPDAKTLLHALLSVCIADSK
ncbi:elongation factor P hydroxylase [Psychrobacter sp.]|uniref:elongation factor P hydroxylase n=1 Tax=Psychrobacter sp. TaxID=56811 RepID=UPI003C7845A7